jgi:hypothetical protein
MMRAPAAAWEDRLSMTVATPVQSTTMSNPRL